MHSSGGADVHLRLGDHYGEESRLPTGMHLPFPEAGENGRNLVRLRTTNSFCFERNLLITQERIFSFKETRLEQHRLKRFVVSHMTRVETSARTVARDCAIPLDASRRLSLTETRALSGALQYRRPRGYPDAAAAGDRGGALTHEE